MLYIKKVLVHIVLDKNDISKFTWTLCSPPNELLKQPTTTFVTIFLVCHLVIIPYNKS